MCVYNERRVSRSDFIRLKQLEKALREMDRRDLPVQYGYDYGDWPIIKPTADRQDFEIVWAHWELIPNWLKTADEVPTFRKKYNTLNAKGETLLTSPMFRQAALNGRCLVLSSGFYEFRHLPQLGAKGQVLKSTLKVPYYITLPGQEYFFIAGISQPWVDGLTGELTETFTLITTEANELMAQVHNSKKRMPTILPENLAYEWVFGDLDEKRIIDLATHQLPSTSLAAHPIRKDFRTASDPRERFAYENLPELAL